MFNNINDLEVRNLKMEIINLKEEIWQYKKDRILSRVTQSKIEKGRTYTSITEAVSENLIYSYDISVLYDTYTKEEVLKAINEYANVEEVEDEKNA